MELHRYLLFAGMSHYPNGGWKDFRGSHETVLDALVSAANLYSYRDWRKIIDRDSGEIVREGKAA